MGKSNVLPLLAAVALVAVLYVIWQKRQAIAQAGAVQPSGYVAVANTVNNKVDSTLDRLHLGFLKPAITSPVKNVTEGNYGDMLGSAMTGGLSDFSSKLNPLSW